MDFALYVCVDNLIFRLCICILLLIASFCFLHTNSFLICVIHLSSHTSSTSYSLEPIKLVVCNVCYTCPVQTVSHCSCVRSCQFNVSTWIAVWCKFAYHDLDDYDHYLIAELHTWRKSFFRLMTLLLLFSIILSHFICWQFIIVRTN